MVTFRSWFLFVLSVKIYGCCKNFTLSFSSLARFGQNKTANAKKRKTPEKKIDNNRKMR